MSGLSTDGQDSALGHSRSWFVADPDAYGERLEDAVESPLARANGLLDPHALPDILEHSNCADHLPAAVAHRAGCTEIATRQPGRDDEFGSGDGRASSTALPPVGDRVMPSVCSAFRLNDKRPSRSQENACGQPYWPPPATGPGPPSRAPQT